MCAARAATHMPVPSLQRRAAVAQTAHARRRRQAATLRTLRLMCCQVVAPPPSRTHPSRLATRMVAPRALHVCAYLRPGPAFRRNRPEEGGRQVHLPRERVLSGSARASPPSRRSAVIHGKSVPRGNALLDAGALRCIGPISRHGKSRPPLGESRPHSLSSAAAGFRRHTFTAAPSGSSE